MTAGRPPHLPEFKTPPLDEVVLGVQFAAPAAYSSVFAKDVWNLYSEEFPKVQELAALEPVFETFGGINVQPPLRFRLGAPVRGRLWFVSADDSHLIQFQEDRLLLNWREGNAGNEYPRFEKIHADFSEYLTRIDKFFTKTFGGGVKINQAELSYINIINVTSYSQLGKWISICQNEINFENFSMSFSEAKADADGKPYARLTHEFQSVLYADETTKAFRVALTFRGKPKNEDPLSSLEFLRDARESIVTSFDQIITDEAKAAWGRSL